MDRFERAALVIVGKADFSAAFANFARLPDW